MIPCEEKNPPGGLIVSAGATVGPLEGWRSGKIHEVAFITAHRPIPEALSLDIGLRRMSSSPDGFGLVRH